MSTSTELQLVLTTVEGDANIDRYQFSQTKTKMQAYNIKLTDKAWNEIHPWQLNSCTLEIVETQEHLGLVRTPLSTGMDLVTTRRLRMGIQTSCSLFGAGLE